MSGTSARPERDVSGAVKPRKVTASVVLLWMRDDLPRERGMEYWKGPHSQLVARNPGFLEYRQHHFEAQPSGLWPATEGVETRIPAERRIDGTPEVTLDGVLGAVRALKPNKLVHEDEANVFGRTILHATALNGGRHFSTSTPGRTGARVVALIRRRSAADAKTFAALLHDQLGPVLAALPGVTEVRTLPFSPYKPGAWNTPGVAHDYPEGDQFHGCVILGATDSASLSAALQSDALAQLARAVAASCSAVHAYPVADTFTNTKDGRVALPQIKPEPKPPLDPVKRVVPQAPPVPEPTRPFPSSTLISLPGHGPEDVVVGADGKLYCGMEGGAIVRLDPETRAAEVAADTGGRPLGLEPLPDGRLVVCDAHRGLLLVDPVSGRVETLTQYIDDVPLRFCSNAAATPDGAIWFTESTNRFDFEHFMGSFFEHRPSGRLMRRDADGSVDVILDDLYFANGLSLTPDESALVLAETSGYRLSRIELTGAQAGQRQDIADNLPGFPDNISAFTNGRAWIGMTGPRSAALDKLGTAPAIVRKLVWRMPEQPGPSMVWCRAINPDGSTAEDLITNRVDFHTVTGVAELNGVLYLASATHSGLLRVDLAGSMSLDTGTASVMFADPNKPRQAWESVGGAFVTGLAAGLLVGVAWWAYAIAVLVAVIGGLSVGSQHRTLMGALLRGLVGGAVWALAVVLGMEIMGRTPTVTLPDPRLWLLLWGMVPASVIAAASWYLARRRRATS